MSKQNNERIYTSPISEYYQDLLKIDSWVVGKTKASQAASLLCAKLQEREERIKERLEYLAKKRGMTSDELWKEILEDKADENLEKDI